MTTLRTTSTEVFACYSKACAPPPAGTGGSRSGGGTGSRPSTKPTSLLTGQAPREGEMARRWVPGTPPGHDIRERHTTRSPADQKAADRDAVRQLTRQLYEGMKARAAHWRSSAEPARTAQEILKMAKETQARVGEGASKTCAHRFCKPAVLKSENPVQGTYEKRAVKACKSCGTVSVDVVGRNNWSGD